MGSVWYRGLVTSSYGLTIASQLFHKKGVKAFHFWCSSDEKSDHKGLLKLFSNLYFIFIVHIVERNCTT